MARKSYDERWERRLRAVGIAVEGLDRLREDGTGGGIELYYVKFKLDADNGTSTLAILQGRKGDQEYVSFVGGLDMASCLLAIRKKLAKDGLRWREAIPWGE